MKRLPMFLIAAGAAIGLAGSSQAGAASGLIAADSAGPPAQLVVYNANEPARLEKTQFFYGGRNYCWYLNGWRGPGYYWCGFNYRRGFGWGGGVGWNGWGGGWRDGWAGNGWRPGYRGPGYVGVRPGYARPGYARPAPVTRRGRLLERRGNMIRRNEGRPY
jgi:hypothetical protein